MHAIRNGGHGKSHISDFPAPVAVPVRIPGRSTPILVADREIMAFRRHAETAVATVGTNHGAGMIAAVTPGDGRVSAAKAVSFRFAPQRAFCRTTAGAANWQIGA